MISLTPEYLNQVRQKYFDESVESLSVLVTKACESQAKHGFTTYFVSVKDYSPEVIKHAAKMLEKNGFDCELRTSRSTDAPDVLRVKAR